MSKGQIKKDFDVVNNDPPRDGANFFENPGIEATAVSEDAGMRATNDTSPESFSAKFHHTRKGLVTKVEGLVGGFGHLPFLSFYYCIGR